MDIIAVTKNRSINEILNLPPQILNIGENKIQEAEEKFILLASNPRKFTKHFIGKLQKNKVKKAVKLFDCIQSVDSNELIEKINSEAKKINKIQEFYFQINISDDPKKNGYNQKTILDAIKYSNNFSNIRITGLMTILKNNLTNEDSLKYYTKMKILFNDLNKTILNTNPLIHLSMGMSDDWQNAVECGSNMLRIGRALFEQQYDKEFLKYL